MQDSSNGPADWPNGDEPPHANLLFGMPASWEDMFGGDAA